MELRVKLLGMKALLGFLGVDWDNDFESCFEDAHQNYLRRISSLHENGQHEGPEAVELNQYWQELKDRRKQRRSKSRLNVSDRLSRNDRAVHDWQSRNRARMYDKGRCARLRRIRRQMQQWREDGTIARLVGLVAWLMYCRRPVCETPGCGARFVRTHSMQRHCKAHLCRVSAERQLIRENGRRRNCDFCGTEYRIERVNQLYCKAECARAGLVRYKREYRKAEAWQRCPTYEI